MKNSKIRYCRNCYCPLSEYGDYCPGCSQKYTTGKVTVRQMLVEFLDAFFSLDNRIFRTLRDIWRPGYLTQKYFEGKHRTYMHPLRFFLLTAIVHFAALNLLIKEQINESLHQLEAGFAKTIILTEYFKELSDTAEQLKDSFSTDATALAAMDSLLAQVVPDTTMDFTLQDKLLNLKDAQGNNVEIGAEEMYNSSYEALIEKYGVVGFFQQQQLHQLMRFYKDPRSYGNTILANAIWMVLLMLPAIAFVLFLLYIRGRYYYVEHLVFVFHIHAFAFLLVTPFYAFYDYLGDYLRWAFLVILIYIFLALWRYYGQGKVKTFVKWMLLNMSYAMIFTIFIILNLLVGFFLF